MTARPIRRNAQTPDRNGKIFYTSTTSLSHISKKWRIAAGVFFIASLLGGASTDGLSVKLEMEESFVTAVVRLAVITVGSFGGGRDSVIGNFLL